MRKPVLSSTLLALGVAFAALMLPTAAAAQSDNAPRASRAPDGDGPQDRAAQDRPGGGESAAAPEGQAGPGGKQPAESAKAPDNAATQDSPSATPPEKGAVVRVRADIDDPEPSKSVPHPLAVAHPDHDVVICIAGCSRDADRVVYKRKKLDIPAKTVEAKQSPLVPASFGNRN
jgi:hypothetical protein